jgi:tRNA A-37 threonylcarbamoyl transferase component Bud32
MVELPPSPDGPRPREPTLEDAAGGLADNADTGDGLDDLLLHRRLKVQMFGHVEPVLVGEFEVAHRLGAGGMGIVYAARDPKLQRDVALKLVKAPDPRGHARILREAQALAKLAHPNVVTVHAVGEHQGRVFVAMELVHGETLRDWIETERPLEDIARVFLQAGQGLAAAHAAGLVHRDFKPDNVIVADRTEEGEGYGVRVVDFGLAREGGPVDPAAVEASAEPITRTGDLGGTFGYMAYEQLCGGQLDARSDVFSFCVSLYEALHGPRPIVADTIEQMTQALRDGAPPDLPWRRDVPARLISIVEAGLSADPRKRPQSLAPLIAQLRRILAPPRGRFAGPAVAVAVVLVGLGVGVGLYSQPQSLVTQPAVVVVEDASYRTSEHVCGEVEGDAPSCEEVTQRLSGPGAARAWDARCDFRRHCATPVCECPAGSEWDGTLGCTLPQCEVADESSAMDRCAAGEVECCVRSAYFRYGGDTSDPATAEAIVDDLSRACAAGEAFACSNLATVREQFHDDHDTAVAALVTGCKLGFAQACRRIAELPEEREGLRPECTTHPDDACPLVPREPVQLLHLAQCRTLVFERPSDDAGAWSAAFSQAGVALEPEETAVLDDARARVDEQVHDAWLALWREATGEAEPPSDGPPLSLATLDVLHRREGAFQNTRALQHVADARAGLSSPRAGRSPSLLQRGLELQAGIGQRLEDEVAAQLGRARAQTLHRPGSVWPGFEVVRMQGTCTD